MKFQTALRIDWREEFARLLQTLQTWPWLETLKTLRQRFREDRLGLTASSLTFTTLISLVPLFTVMLALFSAFPMFANFQAALQTYFLESLVPDNIAKPVLVALTQFASKSNRLGTLGLVLLVATALFGLTRKGATRWLNVGVVIQPSEILKLAMPLMLAWWFQRREGQLRVPDFAMAAALLLARDIMRMATTGLSQPAAIQRSRRLRCSAQRPGATVAFLRTISATMA